MRTAPATSIAFLLVLLAASAGVVAKENITDESLGYKVPRTELFTKVKRLGVLPTVLPERVADRTDVAVRVEERLTRRLQEAGFTVVPSAAYTAAFDAMNKQVGGVYDPVTGRRDRERYKTVQENAERRFIEEQKLDGVVVTSVLNRTALFYDWEASWDGVTEMSTAVPLSGWTRINYTGTNGRLPALSLAVFVSDNRGNTLFSAPGGIQLAGYRDIPKGALVAKYASGIGWLFVPVDDLLRDDVRLDRAVHVATEPLRLSLEQLATRKKDETKWDLPPPPAGTFEKPDSPFDMPRDQVLAQVKRVVIMPLELGQVDRSDAIALRYAEALAAELEKLGWQVDSSRPLEDKRAAEKTARNGFYDPFTGKLDEAGLVAYRKAVMTAGPPVDAVLWASITDRLAPQQNGDAAWDGATQNAMTLGPVKEKNLLAKALLMEPGAAAGRSFVNALSLAVVLRKPDDTVLFHNYGGIQLTQRVKPPPTGVGFATKEDLTALDLFTDPDRDFRAVHLALRPLVLTPEALEAEVDPAAAKKKAKEAAAAK